MSFTIFWTTESKSSFNQIVDYLEKKWSYQIADNFIDRVDEILEHLSQNPALYPKVSEEKNIPDVLLSLRSPSITGNQNMSNF
jgi:plasmid stabilization system protein ParE